MKYLALLELGPDQQISALGPHLLREEIAVWDAYRRGALREMYYQKDPLVVSLVLESAGTEAVRSELAKLPLIRHELLQARIVTMGPWLPLEKLFDKNLLKDNEHE
ncbi:hypothetical protein [Caballeronia sp. LZ001]|uniref:hypothetical protein n=1 Tax=Caballeronia sp. LZ001 TaxID=3038553 RepID=UPI00285425F5|nr:hypothetical protein [Caballeronia sp. LZ001]MDR5806577.1 hypothetical protein [Caballeronia sp. LZ001]